MLLVLVLTQQVQSGAARCTAAARLAGLPARQQSVAAGGRAALAGTCPAPVDPQVKDQSTGDR